MELTLDQALEKGIEAHKAGKVQEADRYYTAILKAQPKHPDANHNMGVLAVGVGKVAAGLPFFKAALESNPKVAQYWLSYIDALIKLDRMTDAKAVLDQAKSNGAKGDGFDKLEERLEGIEPTKNISSNVEEPPLDQMQNLISLYTQGQFEKTLKEASKLMIEFPNSINLYNISGVANRGLGKLEEAIEAYTRALSIKPDYAEASYNMGIALKEQGKLEEAIEVFNKAISIKPDYADAYNNLGNVLREQGKLEESIKAYTKALSIKPDYAEAYNNMGIALKGSCRFEDALAAFERAINITPKNPTLYNNMGNALKEQRKVVEAIEAYNRALSIKPDYADAFNNLGNALKDQGRLDEAIEVYHKALSVKPDLPEAYNNMGIALQEQGKVDEAIDSYNKALSINPDYADAYWNLSGTADNIRESRRWVEKCLKCDPEHYMAKLTKSALSFYEGDKTEFIALSKSPIKDDRYIRTFNWAFNLPKLPPLYFSRWALFDHVINLSKKNRPFYEFGVWRAEAFRYLIKTFKKGYGFDTFEGIPEDWHDEKAGTYSSDGNIPKIEGGQFIVGKFEDTLPSFFAEKRPTASIINFDADLYSSTICALNHAKPVIDHHTILIFDEFIINENWEQDEYKALEEFCANNQYSYEVVAISFFTKQVAVKIIGI